MLIDVVQETPPRLVSCVEVGVVVEHDFLFCNGAHEALDSAILIYYLDGIGPFHARAANRLTTLRAAGDQVAVSDLTRLECRVKRIQLGDTLRLSKFDGFFGLPGVRMVPLTTAVYDQATVIRATHGIKTLDAIHLAAALEGGCDIFLTNDARLSSFHDLTVEILP